MKAEEHANIVSEILKSDNQATSSELLAKLSTDYSAMLAQQAKDQEELQKTKDYNDKLLKANGDLFLQVTTPASNTTPNKGKSDNNNDDEEIPNIDDIVKGFLNKK
jgi:hypothetical protein